VHDRDGKDAWNIFQVIDIYNKYGYGPESEGEASYLFRRLGSSASGARKNNNPKLRPVKIDLF
jgi:hypothetical protein